MTAPLIRSATKRQFLIQLGLDPNDVRTSETYWMLKDEATRAYEAQLQGRSDLLRPEYANQEPPYAAAHFTAEAFSSVVRSIYAMASPEARVYYNRGRVGQGDNWVISWMLYHVCRYRDGRNIRARSRDFHADDDLDECHGSEAKCRARTEMAVPADEVCRRFKFWDNDLFLLEVWNLLRRCSKWLPLRGSVSCTSVEVDPLLGIWSQRYDCNAQKA